MKPANKQQKKLNNASKAKLSEEDAVTKVGRRNKNCRQKGSLGSCNHDSVDVNPPQSPQPNTKNKGRSSCQSTSGDRTLLTRQDQEPTQKLKFQFFPVDDITRMVLQEDGHNPHLELTLGGKKKISSVVKRLVSKWGSSRVAIGELMLFPYDSSPENARKRECCWGLNDAEISASDIHRAMGCPAILRLRYGWLLDVPLHGKSPDKLSSTMVADDKVGPCLETNREFASNVGEVHPPKDEPVEVHKNIDSKEKERADAAWIDGLTNMSFRELFTRANVASPEATQACQLPLESNSRPQQITFNCDSFDAAIAAQLHGIHATTQPANFPTSSILDAEETCHGFPAQRDLPKDAFLRSSGNPVLPLECAVLQPKPTDTEGERFLDLQSNNVQEESLPKPHSQEVGNDCCETTTGLSSQSLVHSCNGNSMGLANISWDSGTQSFCPPSRTTLGGSESIDFGSLLARSRDGHRNCSSNSEKTVLPL